MATDGEADYDGGGDDVDDCDGCDGAAFGMVKPTRLNWFLFLFLEAGTQGSQNSGPAADGTRPAGVVGEMPVLNGIAPADAPSRSVEIG